DVLRAAAEALDRIAGRDVAFLVDREVEAAAAALEEALDDVGAVEADPELVARHARLRDAQLCGAGAEDVADADVGLAQSLGGEVPAERAERQLDSRQLAPPVLVVLGRIRVHRLVGTAVDREIRLAVAVEVEAIDVHAPGDRRLPDGRADDAAVRL